MRRSEASMVLGLAGSWGPFDVKRSYRRLVSVAHPDVGGDARQFRLVQQAYELLEGCSSADLGADHDAGVWPTASGSGDHRMATGAMTYLAVEPDLLDHLAEVCNAWDGQIATAQKAVLRQLGWLVVGVVPIGAVISAAKVQKYRMTGSRFLASLRVVKRDDGMRSAAAWDELGRTYIAMLGLVDLDAAAAAVDLAKYSAFLVRLRTAVDGEDATEIMACMAEAQRFGRMHDLANFVAGNTSATDPTDGPAKTVKPTKTATTKTSTQRLAFAVGKKIGERRR